MDIGVHLFFFFKLVFLLSLDKYSGMEWLDCMVVLFLIYK